MQKIVGVLGSARTYDVMSRLTQATGTGGSWPLTTQPGSWGYAYTANGNRTTYTPSPASSYAYSIVHSPPPTGSNRGEVSAAPHRFDDNYDEGGDRTRSHFGGLYQWHAQTYNDHHGLKRYAYVDDNAWEAPERFFIDYAYNGRRERVKRTPGGPWVDDDPTTGWGVETLHYNEDGQLVAQHRSGGVTLEYVYLDGEPIAFVRSAGTYGGGPKTLYYYHTDHLGTPRRATDQAQAVKWFSVEPYDPFDMLAVSYIFGPGMTFPALRFAGQSTDEMTPFVYNYYRDYDPFKGTYLQSDPIGLAGGINTYAYAANNSLKYIDAYGLLGRGPGSGDQVWGELAGGYSEMMNKQVPGADQYFHCLAACRATKNSNAPMDVRRVLNTKEKSDYVRGRLGLYGQGKFQSHDEMMADVRSDQAANEHGIQCPPERDCKERCWGFLDNLEPRYRPFMREYRTWYGQ